jgi:hypothetical protein
MNYVNIIISTIDLIITGFLTTIPFIFLGYYFLKDNRDTVLRFLEITHSFVLFSAFLQIILMFGRWESFDEFIQFGITEIFFRIYGLFSWLKLLFLIIIPQILWKKRYRRSTWVALLLIPFISVEFYESYVIEFFIDSNWRFSRDTRLVFFFITFVTYSSILAITYFLIQKFKPSTKPPQ